MNKLPQITLGFWVMKICATILGETGGDLVSTTLKVGFAVSSVILGSVFLVMLASQLLARKYYPWLYWMVILAAGTASTTVSDWMNYNCGIEYGKGSLLLAGLLGLTLTWWAMTEKSLSVEHIRTLRGELFYWAAILFSNTLGAALGDFLSNSGLGFAGGALWIGSFLAMATLAYYVTPVSRVLLFWAAFVLTRPFGATMGDVLTKSHAVGGLGFGTIGSSAVLAVILTIAITGAMVRQRRVAA